MEFFTFAGYGKRAMMTRFSKNRAWRAFFTFGILAFLAFGTRGTCAANLASLTRGESLAQIGHDRFFNALFPAERLTLTPEQESEIAAIKQGIWSRVQSEPRIYRALAFLALDPWLKSDDGGVDAGHHVYALLRGGFGNFSDVLPARMGDLIPKTVFGLRFYYLSAIYGAPFGHALARFEENSKPFYHPDLDDFARAFEEGTASRFNRGGIVFDPERNVVRPARGEFDYAIVGSGTSGSVLAGELQEAGYKVIVLESGSLPIPGAVDGTRNDLFYESLNLRFSQNGQVLVRNANVAGGGSTINVDLAFPPTFPSIRARLAKWRGRGLIPYGENEIASAYAWVEEKIGTIELTEDDINENNRVLWEGSKKLGWEPSLYRLNRYPEKMSPYPVSSKASSLEKILIPAMAAAQNPLFLLSDARAERFEFSESGGTRRVSRIVVRQGAPFSDKGVIADPMKLGIPAGTVYGVMAKNVILSAGALGSPALLLRSGAESFNAQIGKSVVLHPSFPLISEFDRLIRNNSGLAESVFNAHFALVPGHGYILEAMSGTPEYGAFMFFDTGENVFRVIQSYQNMAGFGVMLIDGSHEGNSVTIDGAGNPVLNYELDAEDALRLRRGILSTALAAFAAGAKRIAAPTVEMRNVDGTVFFHNAADFAKALEKVEFKPYQTVITSAHLQASLSMGDTPENGAVGLDHKLRGVDNLYVMDASVFPESIGANPMQSLYTFAHLLAQRLIRSGLPDAGGASR